MTVGALWACPQPVKLPVIVFPEIHPETKPLLAVAFSSGATVSPAYLRALPHPAEQLPEDSDSLCFGIFQPPRLGRNLRTPPADRTTGWRSKWLGVGRRSFGQALGGGSSKRSAIAGSSALTLSSTGELACLEIPGPASCRKV